MTEFHSSPKPELEVSQFDQSNKKSSGDNDYSINSMQDENYREMTTTGETRDSDNEEGDKADKSSNKKSSGDNDYSTNTMQDKNYREIKSMGEIRDNDNEEQEDKSNNKKSSGDNDYSTKAMQDENYREMTIIREVRDNNNEEEDKEDKSSNKKSSGDNDCSTNIMPDENYRAMKSMGEIRDNDNEEEDKSNNNKSCGDNDCSTNIMLDESYRETKTMGDTCDNNNDCVEEEDKSSNKKSFGDNGCSTNKTKDENDREMKTMGETCDSDKDEDEDEDKSSTSSIKRHVSHLEDKLLTETSELHNREVIVAKLLQRIKLMESSSPVAAEVSNDGIIDSNEVDADITVFHDSMSIEENDNDELSSEVKQIQLLDKRMAAVKKKLIERNDLIVDLLCHILMLESTCQQTLYEDDVPSNEAVVFIGTDDDDEGGDFVTNGKGNDNKGSQIIGMHVEVNKRVRTSTEERNLRKKCILLEAIIEVENEFSSDEETSDTNSTFMMNSYNSTDSIDTYAIQLSASRNLIEYVFCGMESRANICSC